MKKLKAIINMKCPRCHEGDLFGTATWSFQRPFDMPKRCSICKQDYWPEPGFYYGAMFISYIFWGWVCVLFGVIFIMGLGMSVNQAALVLVLFSVIFFVWLFRISRSIWIHIAIKHRPDKL